MKIKHALNTAGLAITLAFAGAAHAGTEPVLYSSDSNFVGFLTDAGGKSINDKPSASANIQVNVYDMVNETDLHQSFLAFCFQPSVAKDAYDYTAHYNVTNTVVSDKVRALYESSYKDTIGNANQQFSFQLALWELVADDGNLAQTTTGKQYFSVTPDGLFVDARVRDADHMLSEAAKISAPSGMYQYTVFTADNSQTLIAATLAAVPEADTWAMLGAGLGLVGFMTRRKSKKNEQFAA
ncbi:PEP-CTERM sorting domain-containing protein [Pseudoduganella sp. FT26W]|uniref:PEP-CTERM sorting domain-containing protein n=1 Tax=Duganella aquatilis TaxID=2666082 RepID=A0A844D563_9BURK|nr:PEP-CTERM sorting domain-containing protein [Duganella aquatilis]MRW83772.1 PEP-CTERM sorting domain-containing protein [Duganella aquatilis]